MQIKDETAESRWHRKGRETITRRSLVQILPPQFQSKKPHYYAAFLIEAERERFETASGYEHDERARPGPIRDRRRWRKQGANWTAAVESPKERASEDARGLSGTAKGAKR